MKILFTPKFHWKSFLKFVAIFVVSASLCFLLGRELWRGTYNIWESGILRASRIPKEEVSFIFCDVGQGDATLVMMGGIQILIDGGRSSKLVLSCLHENLPWGDTTLELVIATHPDADHIGGLAAVLKKYEVKQIMTLPFVKDTQVMREFQSAVEAEISVGAELKKPFLGQQIRFTRVRMGLDEEKTAVGKELVLAVASPQVEEVRKTVENLANPETILSDGEYFFLKSFEDKIDYNHLSIAVFLKFGQIDFLNLADVDKEEELALIKQGLLHQVEVLKIGHHGSKTSTSADLLEVTQPETSVISVGKNNAYGHPSPEVIEGLMQFESKILRTDELGEIHIKTDGEKYWQE